MSSKSTLLVLLLSFFFQAVSAQTPARRGSDLSPALDGDLDPEYVTDLYDRFTVRLYGSNKFTRYSLGEGGRDEDVLYKSNSSYNVGVGFNYRSLALNFGFRAPFVNNDDDKKGKTKFFDMQAYVYARKFNVDFYAQTYKGYYLAQNDVLGYRPLQTYLRPDLRTRNVGLNVERIFNSSRYSFRAAYLQNEYQQRSAGTFLAGGGLYYLHVTADSAVIPTHLDDGPLGETATALAGSFNKSQVASAAVHGGYAYTLVVSKHLFLMGQVMLGAGLNYTRLSDPAPSPDEEASGVNIHLNGIARAGVGYQGSEWFAGLYFVTNVGHSPSPIDGLWQRYETGVVRLAVARHFELSSKTAERFNRYEPGFMRRR